MKNLEKLEGKLEQMRSYENRLFAEGLEYIAGVDEVGRGPLAGPVVAAAVILPEDFHVLGIDDSKKLTEKKRESLYEEIAEKALCWDVGIIDNETIDGINILEATKAAMKQAIDKVDQSLKRMKDGGNLGQGKSLRFQGDGTDRSIEHVLIDALVLPNLGIPQTGIVKGDEKSVSIAAASIMAKVTRDRLMGKYHQVYPYYAFDKNKGYGTKAHYGGLDAHGTCPLHRQSFLKKYYAQLKRGDKLG